VQTFSLRRFAWALAAFVAVLAVATLGYHTITGEDWTSSFYRGAVTVSLTGLDSKPKGAGAELFTILLLVAGVAIFLYVAGAIVEVIAGGVLTGALADRRRRRAIEKLRDHFIICGYGRVGRRVGSELRAAGRQYVVVDFNPAVLTEARARNDHVVEGNGTRDEDLIAAGIERAAGLVAASDSDVDNLYITVSARNARPEIQIVSRASTEDAASKMLRAGADRVVQPYSSAGQEMAKLMLKPTVSAFLDIVSRHGGPDLRFEEIEITRACPQAGRTIREVRIRHQTGALVVAMRKADGSFDTTPDPDVEIQPGDVLIAVGTENELRALEELFASSEAVAR